MVARAYDGVLVHEWPARQARAAPAIVDTDRVLTYAGLDQRVDDFSRRLTAAGVRGVVGILLPHTADLAVAVLGVLRSGAAYLLMDGTDTDVRHVVTTGLRLNGVDMPVTDSAQPHSRPHDDELAAVVVTSGLPGVGVPHRALANHASAMRERFDLCPEDRVLQCTTAIEAIFPTLASGACAVLCPELPAEAPPISWTTKPSRRRICPPASGSSGPLASSKAPRGSRSRCGCLSWAVGGPSRSPCGLGARTPASRSSTPTD
ncbi:hypothetical protein ALI144C_16805 [Actinosynnema sp. ALI-1.44]|nr:AMP-binding protein [Actinosynnema sp. ALI-1.44]ONI83162.1 hypothetical protein ALI144C_16805 [Actinosynnema sp. ALI-1.44]